MTQLAVMNVIHVRLDANYTIEQCEDDVFNIRNSQGESRVIRVDMNDTKDPHGFAELIRNERWADFVERIDSNGYLEFWER